MSRSLKKGPFVDPILLKKIAGLSPGDRTVIKTWSRDSEVSPEMIGFVFGVHNGKDFIEALITEDMVGHRLGEFALTRKFTKHGGKMQREIESGSASAAGKEAGAAPAAQTGSTSGGQASGARAGTKK